MLAHLAAREHGARARARVRLRKRVNGEVNDGEVLINGSTMGVECAWRFGEAERGASRFAIRGTRVRAPPTQFNPPKYIHYRRRFLFFLRACTRPPD